MDDSPMNDDPSGVVIVILLAAVSGAVVGGIMAGVSLWVLTHWLG